MSTWNEEEDGMGFGGLLPSSAERDEEKAEAQRAQALTDAYAEGRKDEREAHALLRSAAEQIIDAGYMNQEDLAFLRAAWEAA